MLNVLIIGYGVVGNNLENEIKSLSPDIIDKYKPEDNKISKSSSEEGYDLAFVCVNTPFIDQWSHQCNQWKQGQDEGRRSIRY